MKYSSFLFLFLFSFLILKAQNSNSFVVEYGVEYRGIMLDTSYFSDKDHKAMIVKLEKMKERALAYDESYIKLKVNENYAALERIPIMTKDDGSYSVERSTVFLWPYFYDQQKNTFYSIDEIKGKEYYVIKKEEVDWEIKQETKTIIGYECIKALYRFETRKGKKKHIVFWFTPSIPIGLGPTRFRGLPGLILAVEYADNTRYIYARNIKFKENVEIKVPKKERIITHKKAKELRGW